MQTPLIQQFEDGILGLLEALKTAGLKVTPEVEVLPEEKGGIEEAVQVPRVTVAYRQSTFAESARGDSNPFHGGLMRVNSQTETMHADIFIRAKGRSKARGVYAVIEATRGLLLGKEPMPGALGIWFTGQQLDDFEERGNWRYMLSVASSTTIVATPDVEELIASIKLAFNEPD